MNTITGTLASLFFFVSTPREREHEHGATATEYALLVALIAIVLVLAVTAFGEALSTFFDDIATTVDGWT